MIKHYTIVKEMTTNVTLFFWMFSFTLAIMPNLFLLRYANGASTTTSGFSVLTTDTNTPVMSKTPMFTKFVIKQVRHHLSGFTIFYILLSVKKPIWDFVLTWIGHNGNNFFNLFFT